MKRFIAAMLAGTMIFSLAACGSQASDGGVETTGTKTESTTTSSEGTTAAAKAVELNVTTTFAGEDGNAQNFKNAVKAWPE